MKNIDKMSPETVVELIRNMIINHESVNTHKSYVIDNINNTYTEQDAIDCYIRILNMYNDHFSTNIDINSIDTYNDLYTITKILFDLFISDVVEQMKMFFVNYIKFNKKSIYDSLPNEKKKDIDNLYNKERIEDQELSSILSKLYNVMDTILSIDFDNINIFNTIPIDAEVINYINRYTNDNLFMINRFRHLLSFVSIKNQIFNDIKLFFYYNEEGDL